MSGHVGLGYTQGFDPALIVSQIIAMQVRAVPHAYGRPLPTIYPSAQSLLYIDLGLWLLVLNGLSGSSMTAIGLEHFFSHRSVFAPAQPALGTTCVCCVIWLV